MKEIKLVLTDLDGTVVQFAKHEVSERVREAVIACENAGIRVVPVTGRYHSMAEPVLKILGFEDLGIFDNGATIQNCKTGEIVWSKWIPATTIKKVMREVIPYALITDYTPDHYEHAVMDDEHETIAQVSEAVSHLYVLVDKDALSFVEEELRQHNNIDYYCAPSTYPELPNAIGIQINAKGANKFHAAEVLHEMIGVTKQHTLAIGDGDNDVPLFQNAAVKVAVGNAAEMLKAQADYIVASVDDDGFAEAMHRFVLEQSV